MVVLRAQDVTFAYAGEIRAADGLSLTLLAGEFVAVLGPNGSGKTTLVRLMSGLLEPDTGRVTLDDDEVTSMPARERARRIAVVPQSLPHVPRVRVSDFVMGGRYAHGRRLRAPSDEDRAAVRRGLELADVPGLDERPLPELSGGQLQRVFVARALAQESRVLLVDEPTASLDPEHQIAVFRILRDLVRTEGRAVLVVTHDLNLAGQFASRIALLDEGRVAAEGAPKDVLVPGVLEPVYGPHFRYGAWSDDAGDEDQPFVVPWAH